MKMFLTGKWNLNDVLNFFVGYYRYWLYYSKWFGKLMRKHIREQIDFRIRSMLPECYDSGSCIKCGCSTPALQMCSKSCEGLCYPPMMNRKIWKNFRTGIWMHLDKEGRLWDRVDNRFYFSHKLK